MNFAQHDLSQKIAACYLARWENSSSIESFEKFVSSYLNNDAGVTHSFFVIMKGFTNYTTLNQAREVFQHVRHREIHTDDLNYDIGAYRAAVEEIKNPLICFLNTNSEIVGEYWLRKLQLNIELPSVGMVSATGSYESLWQVDNRIPQFPNIHLRSNAFMLPRDLAIEILPSKIENKNSAFLVESGPKSITRQILSMGYTVRMVGRNGRGYLPAQWPQSDIFRQGQQSNLLVHDNVTRTYATGSQTEKEDLIKKTWGPYFQSEVTYLLPCHDRI